MPRVVIFVNGRIPDLQQVRQLILPGDQVIAADGGSRHALSLGLVPSVVIGDMDSLPDEDRHRLEAARAEFRFFPRDKDETDFELALDYAVSSGFTGILVIAALGNRLDQTLGNLALLAADRFAGLDVRVDDGAEEAWFVRGRSAFEGRAGDLVSLIPWGGPVIGITTLGLRWPLERETLQPFRTRGLSNEMLADTASISLESGLLLVVHNRQLKS